MPRRLLLVLIAAVLLAGCDADSAVTGRAFATTPATLAAATTSATPEPTAPTDPATPVITPQAGTELAAVPSGERALEHARVLSADIGVRTAGSPEERRAADYIAGQLRAFGYEVELQPFPISTFISRAVSFHVLSPSSEDLRVTPLTGSVSGAAEGQLFVAGLGTAADYPAGGIGGRIALVRRGQVTFGDMARNAAAAGAAALVVYDAAGDLIQGRLTGQVPGIPALSIPGSDGKRLVEMSTAGSVRVFLSFDGGTEQLTATNVIGRPAGGTCRVIAGGHFDSVAGAPGASDNASGTATMMELARVQAARGNPESACFIAFSGEELGLLGSQYYVEHLTADQRSAVRFMLNFDMTAVGDQWWLVGSRGLQDQAKAIAAAAGVSMSPRELVGASSDHAAFIDRRIPALMIHRWDDRLLHTPADVFERLTAEPMETAVRMGLAFLTDLRPG